VYSNCFHLRRQNRAEAYYIDVCWLSQSGFIQDDRLLETSNSITNGNVVQSLPSLQPTIAATRIFRVYLEPSDKDRAYLSGFSISADPLLGHLALIRSIQIKGAEDICANSEKYVCSIRAIDISLNSYFWDDQVFERSHFARNNKQHVYLLSQMLFQSSFVLIFFFLILNVFFKGNWYFCPRSSTGRMFNGVE
jgi:hypothetical protein